MKHIRAVAIHDISCMGRCSLTVALPILSAAGIEVSVIPTAILSTHTAGFSGYTFRDLTDDMEPIAAHWQSLRPAFDAIYTGYLGSFRQLEIVADLFDRLGGADTLIAVDPAMADNGKLYPAFSAEFAGGMAGLVARADLAVPNITEACLMLGAPYRENYDQAYILELVKGVCRLGPRRTVLTGVSLSPGELGAAAYDSVTGDFTLAQARRIPGYYHGTGDIYASCLVAALLRGQGLTQAAQTAVNFVVRSIESTRAEAGADIKYGVNFEHVLASGDLLNG